MPMQQRFVLAISAGLLAATLCAQAQIPDTPAGHQFLAWRAAQDSGDKATIEQFIAKSMPWGRAEQELAMGKQSGGFDVKKVEDSSDVQLVVLAQQRGPAKQFVRITFNVGAEEPHQIAGIRIQPAQPPAELAPPKMTPAEAEAAHKGIPFQQFSAWLAALNTGDRKTLRKFLEANAPSRNLDADMNFRERTGGLELRGLEQASSTLLAGLVQERDSDQFGRFTIVVEPEEPHRIARLNIQAIPRPAEFAFTPQSEAEAIAALRAKLEKDAAGGRVAGAVLVQKSGKEVFSGAYGLADRSKNAPNKIDTRFRIGSMNKMLTAVAVLQLVQAGKINLPIRWASTPPTIRTRMWPRKSRFIIC
jgi:hypothetical protein